MGNGRGRAIISDTSYLPIAILSGEDDLKPDLHELNLTSSGTALVTAYRPAAADLSGIGGPANGYVLAGMALEIDVATGTIVSSWDSLEHVPVEETYLGLSGGTKSDPFDYFHINSIDVAPDGDLLISGRSTWAIYKVGRSSGKVVWRLNGKKSDFVMEPGARLLLAAPRSSSRPRPPECLRSRFFAAGITAPRCHPVSGH